MMNLSFCLANLGNGITIAIVGWCIVFAALILLFFVFSNIPKLINAFTKKTESSKRKSSTQAKDTSEVALSGEVNAAISSALYMYFNEMHDEESNIITIEKVSRTYSPWSSKIYGVSSFKR